MLFYFYSPDEIVSLSLIESLAKRQKMDKEERLESIRVQFYTCIVEQY